MNCPKCGNELVMTPGSMCIEKEDRKIDFCFKCFYRYSEDELQKIKDIEMLDEDHEIWKSSKRIK